MDIGFAFLLGILLGQWILLIVIWRAVSRLVELVTQSIGQDENPTDHQTTIINLEERETFQVLILGRMLSHEYLSRPSQYLDRR